MTIVINDQKVNPAYYYLLIIKYNSYASFYAVNMILFTNLFKLFLRKNRFFSASDNYIFVTFGSNSGPISDTTIRVFNKTMSSPGLSASSRIGFGQPQALANNVAMTYNFEVKIVLACGGQQVIFQNNFINMN